MASSDEQASQVAALRAELADLRAEVTALRSQLTARSEPIGDTTSSRRDLLTRGGIATAAGLAGAFALPHPAAASGDVGVIAGSDLNVASTSPTGSGLRAVGGSLPASEADEWGAVHAVDTRSPGTAVRAVATHPTGTALVAEGPKDTSVRLCGGGVLPDGTAVSGSAPTGVGGSFSGGVAALRLEPSGPAPLGQPQTELHGGELYVDDDGGLWFFSGDRWVDLISSASPPGSFRPIPPYRAYDSRFGDGRLRVGSAREVDVFRRIDVFTGNELSRREFDSHVGAISFNLTITNTTLVGFLSVSATERSPASSSINWTDAGQTIANGSFSTLTTDGTVFIRAGGAFLGGCDVILDVTGVYTGIPDVTVTRT